jgi:hypothetical protein
VRERHESEDIYLGVPGTHSESDLQIIPGWITAQPDSGRERLRHVTQWMLERLQLGYGDPEAPVLRVVEHDMLIHMMVQSV